MRTPILLAILAATSAVAHAAPSKADITWFLLAVGPNDGAAVRFAFDLSNAHADPKSWEDADPDRTDLIEMVSPTIATSTDGKAAWVATHLKRSNQCAGLTGTIKQCGDPKDTLEVTLLLEADGKKWRPVAVHSARAMADKEIAKALAAGTTLDAITRHVDPAAADAAKLFEGSIGDPKALAATISDRKDAVLIGSAPGEKTVGGARIRAAITSWKLAFSVHDGVAAGTTATKTVAWVAANLDSRPAGKADAKPTPYRALFIYEQKAGAWQLVAAQFSFAAVRPPQGT